jgi:hypothetical protein
MGGRIARRFFALALVVSVAAIAACGSSATKSDAASCPGSRPFPQSYTEPGTLTTKIQFAQSGCNVAIVSIELYAQTHLLRRAVFNPPLPAGSLADKGASSWTGTGKFRSTGQQTGHSGAVSLTQEGIYKATAALKLTEQQGGPSTQWATSATASSQFNQDKWYASQATGAPNGKAWAPLTKDGTTEWLELTYAQAVIPTAIKIWESLGPGFVTKVEAYDKAKNSWSKLWEGTDLAQGTHKIFSPPLAKSSLRVDRIRLTVNTNAPDWNEVEAVALLGAPEPVGRVLWLRGSWLETGKETACIAKNCKASAIVNPPSREWSIAFNTATGKVGTTPDQVR